LREQFGTRAVEMEGSGVADATWSHGVGYLVVRGVCDYCDANKNDQWQTEEEQHLKRDLLRQDEGPGVVVSAWAGPLAFRLHLASERFFLRASPARKVSGGCNLNAQNNLT